MALYVGGLGRCISAHEGGMHDRPEGRVRGVLRGASFQKAWLSFSSLTARRADSDGIGCQARLAAKTHLPTACVTQLAR